MASPAAIIRVKRKITDDPVEALVLSFKRRRGNASSDDDHRANEVFRFTGTVPAGDNQGNDPSAVETRDQLKRIFSSGNVTDRIVRTGERRLRNLHVADIKLKSKQEKEEALRQQRENLLLSVRAVDVRDLVTEQTDVAASLDNVIKNQSFDTSILPDSFLEIDEPLEQPSVSAITCNDQPLVRVRPEDLKKESGGDEPMTDDASYVFDYYFPSDFCGGSDEKNDHDFAVGIGQRKRTSTSSTDGSVNDVTEYFSNLIDVYPYNLCEEAIDNGATEAIYQGQFDEDSDDDEDSNAESNWRNDYPEEDDEFEKRYDFYDQNYDSGEEQEAGDLDEVRGDGMSVIKDLRGLRLGAKDEDAEDDSGDDQLKQKGYYDSDEYDPDD